METSAHTMQHMQSQFCFHGLQRTVYEERGVSMNLILNIFISPSSSSPLCLTFHHYIDFQPLPKPMKLTSLLLSTLLAASTVSSAPTALPLKELELASTNAAPRSICHYEGPIGRYYYAPVEAVPPPILSSFYSHLTPPTARKIQPMVLRRVRRFRN